MSVAWFGWFSSSFFRKQLHTKVKCHRLVWDEHSNAFTQEEEMRGWPRVQWSGWEELHPVQRPASPSQTDLSCPRLWRKSTAQHLSQRGHSPNHQRQSSSPQREETRVIIQPLEEHALAVENNAPKVLSCFIVVMSTPPPTSRTFHSCVGL